ncbi:MAG: AraC family transcriptional regulator [Clostridiales bacterium]|nr:AraC family transcriptional regulator [Clostridiales bacterium]
MTVQELMALAQARELTPGLALDGGVTCGYVCDLLSWVMARGQAGMAWVTVQTHMNVVAVASLHEMACVILPDGILMDEAPLEKAREEGIVVLSSQLSAYELCGLMYAGGLAAPAR